MVQTDRSCFCRKAVPVESKGLYKHNLDCLKYDEHTHIYIYNYIYIIIYIGVYICVYIYTVYTPAI